MHSHISKEKLNLAPKKKVLIVTYYWPPSGGSGVQRWVKFAKYLPEFNIEPIVLTVKNGTYPLVDDTMVNEVSPNLKVFSTKAIEPYSLFGALSGKTSAQVSTPATAFTQDGSIIKKLGIWIRANLFVPDARLGWKPFAYKKATEIIKEFNIDTVITTGPPNSTHLIGSKLKSKNKNLHWIMDMRDPWTKIFFYDHLPRTKFTSRLDLKFEKKALRLADEVVLVSKSMISLQKEILDRDYKIVSNGFDHSDFPALEQSHSNPVFTIKYIGSMSENSVPHNFFKALSRLESDSKKKIKVEFYGSINTNVIEIIEAFELDDIVSFRGYLPHLEAKKEMQKSDLLLLVIPRTKDNELIITGKIFDYIGAQKPILCIGPKHGDAAKVISEFNLGLNFEYDEVDTLTSELEKLLNSDISWKISQQKDLKIHPFSRYNLTKKLSEIIYSVSES